MPDRDLIEEAKIKSIDLIRSLVTPQGFIASSQDVDNYKKIFSRDGIIAGIASVRLGEKDLTNAFKQTLLTLQSHQDITGRIPSNVSLDEKKVSYGTTVGRIDASIWYIVGVCLYYTQTKDKKFIKKSKASVEKVIFYLECLEMNGRGFIYVPSGGDWADEYINEGYVLFDQALYLIALELYSQVFKDTKIQEKINHLKSIIAINFFPSLENAHHEDVYQAKLFKKILDKYTSESPIASFSGFGANYYYDLFGISLLFNTGILEKDKIESIEKELIEVYEKNLPLYPAFYPVITENDKDWEKLNNNYLFRLKNKPHEYHNGGLWGVAHGFFLASKSDLKEHEVVAFADILRRDDYVFPEFYHGKTLEGLGTHKLGFTASGYLLAYQKLINKNNPLEI